jgi:rod shape-determining protein MreC
LLIKFGGFCFLLNACGLVTPRFLKGVSPNVRSSETMKNFLRFLWQHNFVALFILLELMAMALVVSNNPYHKASFVSSSRRVSGGIYNVYNSLTQFFTLEQANRTLAEENAFLRSRLPGSMQLSDNYIRLVTDSLAVQNYVFRAARVINNSVNRTYNFITIDRGRLHGIGNEMGVVCTEGVVGIVREVSNNYATVVSLLNQRLKVSAKLKDTDYFGSIEWNGISPRYVNLAEVPLHAVVKKGDWVVTSGFSSIFPEGIPIGEVDEVDYVEGESYYQIKVKLSVDFNKLSYVETIENRNKNERLSIEKSTEND